MALARIRQLRLDLKATSHLEPAHQQLMDELEAATKDLYATFEAEYRRHFSDMERVKPFHWAIEFPECFFDSEGKRLDNSGFQVIIGNPPWEIVKPDLREYYAQFDETIEARLSRAQAETRIAQLDAEDPTRRATYEVQRRDIEEQRTYYQTSKEYTRQGQRSDTATHKLFMERSYAHLLAEGGRLGYVVPSGIYTDFGTKELREMLLKEGRIEYLYGIANVRSFFPGVDSRFKFTMIGSQKGTTGKSFDALFFISHAEWSRIEEPDAQHALEKVINNPQYHFEVSTDAISRFSPDSLSIMEFTSERAYEVVEKIYANRPLIGEEIDTTWNIHLSREFHVTDDRDLFHTDKKGLPLYEGKMIHQYDANFAEPQYWVVEEPAAQRLQTKTVDDYRKYRLGFRDIARSTDERTLISTILPKCVFCNNKVPIVMLSNTDNREKTLLYINSVFNSFVLDFIIRQKVSTTLNFFYMYTLPMPRLVAGNPYFDALVARAACLTCVHEAFDALWREVMGTAWVSPADSMYAVPTSHNDSVGTRYIVSADQTPAISPMNGVWKPVTDAAGRQVLRDEIDALVAHLYGLSRDEFAHILGTFPLVFADNAAGQAKKAQLLAVYDTFAPVVKDWARG